MDRDRHSEAISWTDLIFINLTTVIAFTAISRSESQMQSFVQAVKDVIYEVGYEPISMLYLMFIILLIVTIMHLIVKAVFTIYRIKKEKKLKALHSSTSSFGEDKLQNEKQDEEE